MQGGGRLSVVLQKLSHRDMAEPSFAPKPGPYIFLTVEDTGTGMDSKTLERIFDPFFTTKGLVKGTGLGLASAYGIVKAHGGHIEAESDPGKGTRFKLYFPAIEKTGQLPEKKAEQAPGGDGIILLADDEEILLDVGTGMLNHLGFEVLQAAGGEETLRVYEKNQDRITLIILDLIMPDLSGGEVFDRLKAMNPHVKVLLSSGYTMDDRTQEILERGCSGFIQKPFKISDLSTSIQRILENNPT
jgi:CheY-like chemotaxis protein